MFAKTSPDAPDQVARQKSHTHQLERLPKLRSYCSDHGIALDEHCQAKHDVRHKRRAISSDPGDSEGDCPNPHRDNECAEYVVRIGPPLGHHFTREHQRSGQPHGDRERHKCCGFEFELCHHVPPCQKPHSLFMLAKATTTSAEALTKAAQAKRFSGSTTVSASAAPYSMTERSYIPIAPRQLSCAFMAEIALL